MPVVTIKVARRDVPRQQISLPSHSIPLAISGSSNYFLKYVFTNNFTDAKILMKDSKMKLFWVFSINKSK